MEKTYIATFYSHFGAIKFRRICMGAGWTAIVMPVPRDLSSSCGTCVRYEGTGLTPSGEIPEEVEQIVLLTPQGYDCRYRAEDS